MSLKHLPSYIMFLPLELRKNAMEGFNYSAHAPTLAAGATAVVTVAIQNNSDFLWVDITGVATDPANPETVFPTPAVALQIEDSGASDMVFQQPLHWGNVVGTAQLPGEFAYPYLAEMGGQLTVTYTNLGAQAYTLWVAFRGFKVFQFGPGINQ